MSDPRRPLFALIGAIAYEVLLFVFGQQDMPADDPLYYAEIAHRIATDPATFAELTTFPWDMRIGVTVPLAALYRIAGVSPLVTNAIALVSTLAILLAVWAAVETPRARFVGVLLALGCASLAHQGSTLSADLPCAALLVWTVVGLARRDRATGRRWLVASIAFTFAAFLVKETAVWCAPIWLYVIVVDVRAIGARATLARYAPAVAAGVVLAAAYLVLSACVWGDPLARFHGIHDLDQDVWSLAGKPASVWLGRLTWQPALLALRVFGIVLPPALLALWLVRGRHVLWLVAASTIVLLYWFGSVSLFTYRPLPLWPRQLLPALPFVLIVATLAVDRALERWPARAHLMISLVLVASLGAAGFQAQRQLKRARPVTAAIAELNHVIARGSPVILVCGDRWLPTMVRYHYGFEPPPNLIVRSVDELVADPSVPAGAQVLAIINTRRIASVPDTRALAQQALPQMFAYRSTRIYVVPDPAQLARALQQAMP